MRERYIAKRIFFKSKECIHGCDERRKKKKEEGLERRKRKRKKEMKPAHIVGFEALVVGMCLALMFYAGTRIAPRGTLSTVAVAFVCGALFHIACEIFGVNAWYARTYFSN